MLYLYLTHGLIFLNYYFLLLDSCHQVLFTQFGNLLLRIFLMFYNFSIETAD